VNFASRKGGGNQYAGRLLFARRNICEETAAGACYLLLSYTTEIFLKESNWLSCEQTKGNGGYLPSISKELITKQTHSSATNENLGIDDEQTSLPLKIVVLIETGLIQSDNSCIVPY
jgi:hypothetical protein